MYAKPKGLLPSLVALVGLLIPMIAIILYLPVGGKIINSMTYSLVDTTGSLVFTAIILFFPFFFGILFSSMFPEIKIVKQGISYRFWQFFDGIIKWEEIEAVIVQKDVVVITISRPGIPLFNGLYFNKLHGLILKKMVPVLLVSLDISARDELLQVIGHNSSCPIKQRKD